MMRIPKHFINPSRLKEFASEVDEIEMLESGKSIIVDIDFSPEEPQESQWMDLDKTCEEWLESLRNEVISGDLRLSYLLWLTAVERGFLRNECKEPLAEIGPLSAPLKKFAKFVKIDSDLVQSAAELSGSTYAGGASVDVSSSAIASIPDSEKVELLRRIVDGDPHVAADIRRNARTSQGTVRGRTPSRHRTVAEIRKRMLTVGNERRATALRRRGARVWTQIETEINSRTPQGYDKAIELLVDARTLSQETGAVGAFSRRVRGIKERHRRKWRCRERLKAQQM